MSGPLQKSSGPVLYNTGVFHCRGRRLCRPENVTNSPKSSVEKLHSAGGQRRPPLQGADDSASDAPAFMPPIVADEHEDEADEQQSAADPDGADVGELRHETAEACACGEDLTAADVGIGVLKAAGERDEDRCAEGIGHLPVKMMTVLHTALRLS